MRPAIADFSYSTKNTDLIRRYGLKAYYRSLEAGNMNSQCPSIDVKAFDYWSYGILCLNAMCGKFLQNKENKRREWENDIYPLLLKSLQYSISSKLVNKLFSQSLLMKQKLNIVLI